MATPRKGRDTAVPMRRNPEDVTANRLHTSWYDGGVHVYDVSEPADPTYRAGYDPDGSSFWTAVAARGATVATEIGGGVVVLHDDRGERSAPGFEASVRRGEGPSREHHARPE